MTDKQVKTSRKDRERLRTVAARYAEIANSEEMARLQVEDNGTFFKDLLPELQCAGNVERKTAPHEALRRDIQRR